jgi:transcriptional regulator with XRE-family HTH domain
MITLTSDHQIGPVLRKLRLDAGLTMRQLGARAHMSTSGIAKREHARAGYVGILIGHAGALGFDVALVPLRHPGARNTGTGWPA